MNLKRYQALPADLRQAVDDAARATCALDRKSEVDKEKGDLDFIRKSGVQVNEVKDLKAFQDRMAPAYDLVASKVGKDLLVDVLPGPLQRAAHGLGVLVAIGFSAVLIQQGWAFMELGRGQTLPVSGVSKAWVYAAMPVGGPLIVVYTLPRLWRILAGRG